MALKKIDCKIIRVTEITEDGTKKYEIAEHGVTEEEVHRYKEWLSRRSK